MTVLWLDPGFGASGDMLLGAMVGAGAPLDRIRDDLSGLDVDGWTVEQTETDRAGIASTRVEVKLTTNHDHGHSHEHGHEHDHSHEHSQEPSPSGHRAWSTIDELLASANLPAAVIDGARRTFRALGEVEAAIHMVDIDQVHFHEVGAVDAIVDIVGTWSALHHLGVDEVHAAPVGLGSGGTVSTAHGELPVPAPATLALLDGLPVKGLPTPAETVTPTGAALLATMVTQWGPIPTGRLLTSARGAGGRNPATHPNVLSAIVIDAATPAAVETPTWTTAMPGADVVTSVVLATNVDDVTPEVLGHTIERLLEAGADDAWLVPIGMKKNRPGNELRVLCAPDVAPSLAGIVFDETGTLGLRSETVAKVMLDRHMETVSIRGFTVRVKVGPNGAKAEHDDLVKLSADTGVSVRQLALEVGLARLTGDNEPLP